jgi:hypothetical protein
VGIVIYKVRFKEKLMLFYISSTTSLWHLTLNVYV